jgi:RsiW-degrading membrane proteinase PrsW (M82 family)
MGSSFVEDLAHSHETALKDLAGPDVPLPADPRKGLPVLLRVALANEISVSELAAFWMPDTPDWEVKLALAKQAGDEARHFGLVEERLKALGVNLVDFQPPPVNPLFEFLRGLKTPVERVAAGMFALESVAYAVNESFLRYCSDAGDEETAEVYRRYIQPDERHHRDLGGKLLARLAAAEEAQALARAASARTLEIARAVRAGAKQKLGAACLPGC